MISGWSFVYILRTAKLLTITISNLIVKTMAYAYNYKNQKRCILLYENMSLTGRGIKTFMNLKLS